MEVIQEIKAVEEDYREGYEVTTNFQVISLLIDNQQNCCESWGYFWSNDNPQDFIGATLRDITLTDTLLNTEKLGDIGGLDEGGVMFVTLDTDKGQLQFVAYNGHNGYYGHTATVKSRQLSHSAVL